MTNFGEWWLFDGQAIAADEDVGDASHETVVANHLLQRALEALAASSASLCSLVHAELDHLVAEHADDSTAIRISLYDWADGAHKEGHISDNAVDDLFAAVRIACGDPELDDEFWDHAFLTTQDVCLRSYARRKLGWTRMAGTWLNLHGISETKLREIARSLDEIVPEEDDIEATTWRIEDTATGRCYHDVTYGTLQRGDVRALFYQSAGKGSTE